MNNYYQNLTVSGYVISVDNINSMFKIKCRSGDLIDAFVSATTSYNVLQNLDNLNRDRVPDPLKGYQQGWSQKTKDLTKYITEGRFVIVQGIMSVGDQLSRFEAKTINLLH